MSERSNLDGFHQFVDTVSRMMARLAVSRSDLVMWLAIASLGGSAAAIFPEIAVAVALLAIVLGVFRWPRAAMEVAVLGALAVRPSLDRFGERRLGWSVFQANPAVAFGVVILLVAACLAVIRARSGRSVWSDARLRNAHAWLFAAYGIGLLSGWRLYGSLGLNEGIREFVRVASIIGAFLVALWWVEEDEGRYPRGWLYLIIGLVPPLCVATWQLVTGTGYREAEGLNQLTATFSHPNSFGPYLVPFILAAVSSAAGLHGPPRWLRLAGAAGLSAVVILTFSRTALLVLAVALLLLPFLHARKFGARALIRASIVVASVIIVGWLVAGNLVRTRFASISSDIPLIEAARTGVMENSLQWRLVNWTVLIRLGMDAPLAGHGAGMTEVLNPIVNQNTGIPFNAHNDFVRFFFETGFFGLACYLVYGLALGAWALRAAQRAIPRHSAAAFAVVAAFLSMLFFTAGTTELSLQTAVQYELYGMLALLTAEAGRGSRKFLQSSIARRSSESL